MFTNQFRALIFFDDYIQILKKNSLLTININLYIDQHIFKANGIYESKDYSWLHNTLIIYIYITMTAGQGCNKENSLSGEFTDFLT